MEIDFHAIEAGFTQQVFWNGYLVGYSCPVCFNSSARGHTGGCPRGKSHLTQRPPDLGKAPASEADSSPVPDSDEEEGSKVCGWCGASNKESNSFCFSCEGEI
jgi:hypothetical protein